MKNKKCRICNEKVNKRNVCKKCKDKYSFQTSGEHGNPFNRKKLFEKDKIRSKK